MCDGFKRGLVILIIVIIYHQVSSVTESSIIMETQDGG